jgi:hypothetical protein
MENRSKASPLAELVAVAIASLAAGYAIGAAITVHLQDQSRLEQPPFVNKALDLYSHGKVSRGYLLSRYAPTVVYLPNMTCVAMKPRKPFAGGEDTMCFDKSERQLLFYYTNGD